ncbi:hypothetical protein [Telmatospirillum sp. J64-1]|uniref:hypothetical protein n=1 Tax=Telmatospirillum sp. J64-1 TaxID=2502183 RepID=UPI00115EE8F9|nr:hypothetical protein [Telmatospirillum sp. J64-1]
MKTYEFLKNVTFGVVLSALAAGCTYQPGMDDPVSRRVTWFTFVQGNDIRDACGAGQPDRYRVIYNGDYEEQVRVYEIGREGPRRLIQEVRGGGVDLSEGWTTGDLMGPWRGTREVVELSDAQYATLISAFAESGMFAPPPVGLHLESERHFWTAAACHQGQYHFTAWLYPSERYERMTLDAALLALDVTGVAFRPPQATVPAWMRETPQDSRVLFTLTVGTNGLAGIP